MNMYCCPSHSHTIGQHKWLLIANIFIISMTIKVLLVQVQVHI